MEIDRRKFITLTGMSAAGLLLSLCTIGCKKDNADTDSQPVDFTLDLNATENASLKNNGGSRVVNNTIVARTTAGNYIAVASKCTHQGTTVNFEANNNRFRCPNHGAVFSTTGAVVNGPASEPLTQYKTELNGNNLRIFS
jgi:cytochrome b6-f complex iron-sulfur subunit